MFKRILVPLDGSEESEQIVGWVSGLAKGLGSEICLMTVIDPSDLPSGGYLQPVDAADPAQPAPAVGSAVFPPMPAGGPPIVNRAKVQSQIASAGASGDGMEQFHRRATEEANLYLQSVGHELEEGGLRLSTEVGIGDPAEVIVDTARRVQADVIALATRRESAIARGILGSVTDRVLHSTDLPTFVIQPKDEQDTFEGGAPGTVIVPLDGSELSEAAVPYAMDIARSLKGKLIFMRAMGLPYAGSYVPYTPYAAYEYEAQVQADAVTTEGVAYLDQFVEEAKAAGLEVESRLYSGGAANRIIDEAEERPDSIVVMTTRGRSGIKRWVMGSVTDKVVRSSPQPVLVLPASAVGVEG